jgi:serine protease AprX
MNSVAYRLRYDKVQKLVDLPYVARVSMDVPVGKKDEFTANNSGATAAFQQFGLTGAGVTVAVLDSGIRVTRTSTIPLTGGSASGPASTSLPMARPRWRRSLRPWHPCGWHPGRQRSSLDRKPVLPDFLWRGAAAPTWWTCASGRQRQGHRGQRAQGIDWVIANRATHNIRVMNLSLGHFPGESYTTDPLCWPSSALMSWDHRCLRRGQLGRFQDTHDPLLNNGGYGTQYGSINSRGNSPFVITVGAMKASAMAAAPLIRSVRTQPRAQRD